MTPCSWCSGKTPRAWCSGKIWLPAAFCSRDLTIRFIMQQGVFYKKKSLVWLHAAWCSGGMFWLPAAFCSRQIFSPHQHTELRSNSRLQNAAGSRTLIQIAARIWNKTLISIYKKFRAWIRAQVGTFYENLVLLSLSGERFTRLFN